MILPAIQTLEEYRQVHSRPEVWDAAFRVICQRHGRAYEKYQPTSVGSHVVRIGPGRDVLKLYSPVFPDDAPREREALGLVAGRLPCEVPEILFAGEVEGWPYLGLSYVAGEPIGVVWPGLSASERLALASEIGELLACLHRLPIDSVSALDVAWPRWIANRTADATNRQRRHGWETRWLNEIPSFLEGHTETSDPPGGLVLLNADLTEEHILLTGGPGNWRISGVIDFADSMVGHPDYDFLAPGLIALAGDGPSQRRMLEAYGMAPDSIGPRLARRLMQWTLLHLHASLPEIVRALAPGFAGPDLDALGQRLWPL